MSRLASLIVASLLLTVGVAPAVTAAPATPDAASTTPDVAPTTVEATDQPVVDRSPLDRGDARTLAPNNTTARLGLRGERTGNYSTPDLDFGGAMALSSERVETEYRVELVTLQLERVDGQSARNAVVDAYLDASVERLKNLSATEQEAVRRYRTGAISAETLLFKLALVDMRARTMQESLDRVQRAGNPLPTSTSVRIADIQMELDGFQTRNRGHVADAVRGDLESPVNPLHVTASRTGVVVEMLEDDRYYRNAVRFDNRAPGAIDRLKGDLGQFQERLEEIYPWAFDPSRISDVNTYPDRNVYWANYGHPQGSIETFVDGATTDVYREEQSLVLDRLPVAESRSRTVDNLTVRVARTPNGGPFKVNVTKTPPDAEGDPTPVPVDAEVTVDGRAVATTGDDGVAWVIAPVGDYEVTVERANTTINVSVSP